MTDNDSVRRYLNSRRMHLVDPSAFNAGLEQAAAWHDAEAARTKAARTKAARKIAIHQISAAAIRSMKRGENSNG